jgi:hypothetical protein
LTALLLAGLIVAALPGADGLVAPAPGLRGEGEQYAQLTFHSRVVVRVQTVRAKPAPQKYKDKKGPRCVEMEDVAGAAVIAPNSVDIVLRGGDRVRAIFAASCPGLDYYSGFYVVPHRDAKICSRRDMVRDRAGSECAIDRFRKLIPVK